MKIQIDSTMLTYSCQKSIRLIAEIATRNTITPSTQAFHAAVCTAPTNPVDAASPVAAGAPEPNCRIHGEMKNQTARIALAQSCQEFSRTDRRMFVYVGEISAST